MSPFDVKELFAQYDAHANPDHALASRFAPIIQFDAHEPFLPLAAGYTVFREDQESSSFPMRIELYKSGLPPAAAAIEYAIWWDWDIQHLYELEHIWVYLNEELEVVRGEASWHGRYNAMTLDDKLPLMGERLTLCSEPGKHAFAPIPEWFTPSHSIRNCGTEAGIGGVCITPLFAGRIPSDTAEDRDLVLHYLQGQAFVPKMAFTQIFEALPDCVIPWPLLSDWIPGRVAGWLTELAWRKAGAK